MKQVTGNKKIIIGIGTVIIIVAIVGIFFRLTWKYEYYDEATVLKQYVEKFSEPEQVEVLALDKYVISDKETYYYIKVRYEPFKRTKEFDLLLVYNHNSKVVDEVHFGDMEAGYYDEEKIIWDEIKQKRPDVSFSKEVIDEIIEVVLTK